MPIKASASSNSQSTPVSAGSHHAVCYGVVAIGTQPSEKFAPRKKVIILWELPHERGDFGDKTNVPRVISKRYTLSLGERASLKADLQNWRGKPFTPAELNAFEIDRLIGANCFLGVVHEDRNGRTYANVTSVMPLPKGMAPLKAELPRLYFNLEEALEHALVTGTQPVLPDELPEWIKNLCALSEEWQAHVGGSKPISPPPTASAPAQDESVPF